MNKVEQARADRAYWVEVGQMIDPESQLIGWSGRYQATFTRPIGQITGLIAEALMRQKADLQVAKEVTKAMAPRI